jgi:hypothetical protein
MFPEATRAEKSRPPASQRGRARGKPIQVEPATENPASPDARPVDLRPLKAAVQGLALAHPARTVILAEPDSLSREDYAAKAVVWFRLLRLGDG